MEHTPCVMRWNARSLEFLPRGGDGRGVLHGSTTIGKRLDMQPVRQKGASDRRIEATTVLIGQADWLLTFFDLLGYLRAGALQ
jgi:hypothetical protein